MPDIQTLRQQLVVVIAGLPEEALVELVSFVDYLRYKSSQEAAALPNQQHPINPEMVTMPSSTTQSEAPLYERLPPEELAQAFRAWVESHDPNTPGLSDYAVSRESMYEDEVF